jgi:hypothetical protein
MVDRSRAKHDEGLTYPMQLQWRESTRPTTAVDASGNHADEAISLVDRT